jgi:hypothetical protein
MAADGEIVDLSGDEHLETVVDAFVQAPLMSCGLEAVSG